jgi:hypothetical protein
MDKIRNMENLALKFLKDGQHNKGEENIIWQLRIK